MGAWIEIELAPKIARDIFKVAPLVGAWIEIKYGQCISTIFPSHPLWVRGLKSIFLTYTNCTKQVAPLVGAWIEIDFGNNSYIRSFRRTPCGCVD